MLLNRETQKMTLYFGEQFLIISVKSEWLECFVRDMLAVNPDIDYGFVLGEPDKKE